jgi:hypothetical protein
MTGEELLELARQAVPEHLRSLARISTRGNAVRAASAKAGAEKEDDQAVARALAKRLGVKLPAARRAAVKDSADVEFVESTPLGQKSTVVQIRKGKVAKILRTV